MSTARAGCEGVQKGGGGLASVRQKEREAGGGGDAAVTEGKWHGGEFVRRTERPWQQFSPTIRAARLGSVS